MELISTLEARILDVCGWFIRPVFRRDKYDLGMLVDSTLAIVKELDARYAFTESVDLADQISLK